MVVQNLDFLPGKKTAISLVIALLIVAGSFLVSAKNRPPKPEEKKASADQQVSGLVYTKTDESKGYSEQIKEALGSSQYAPFQSDAQSDSKPLQQFGVKDIKLAQDEDPQTLKSYGISLAIALKEYNGPKDENIVGLALELFKNEEPEPVMKLLDAEKRILTTIDKLLAIPIPASAVDIHLELVNRLAHMGFLISSIQDIVAKPEIGLLASQNYAEESYAMHETIGKINKYFANNNVSFTEEEKVNVNVNLIR
jgi:hypothetical protein